MVHDVLMYWYKRGGYASKLWAFCYTTTHGTFRRNVDVAQWHKPGLYPSGCYSFGVLKRAKEVCLRCNTQRVKIAEAATYEKTSVRLKICSMQIMHPIQVIPV